MIGRAKGEPVDVGSAQALWEQEPYQFQHWATSLLEAYPQEHKRSADRVTWPAATRVELRCGRDDKLVLR